MKRDAVLPLFDLLENHGDPRGSDRFKIWSLAHLGRRGSKTSELRCLVVTWHHPRSFIPPTRTPWSVCVRHHYYEFRPAKRGRNEMRYRSRDVNREFADRAACLALAEKLLLAFEAVERTYAAADGEPVECEEAA